MVATLALPLGKFASGATAGTDFKILRWSPSIVNDRQSQVGQFQLAVRKRAVNRFQFVGIGFNPQRKGLSS
jgi:hypothetical protein